MATLDELVQVLNRGRIAFLNDDRDRQPLLNIVAGRAVNGDTVTLAPGLIDLLLRLARSETITVLSLYRRRGEDPHGRPNPEDGGFLCQAVDIAGYGGLRIDLEHGPAEQNIRIVTNLIRNFPAGTFDLGFPRPRFNEARDTTDFHPELDIFFPVPKAVVASYCLIGWHHRGAELAQMRDLTPMLEPARTQVRAAMSNSPARFGLKYPDGKDHLHVKAY